MATGKMQDIVLPSGWSTVLLDDNLSPIVGEDELSTLDADAFKDCSCCRLLAKTLIKTLDKLAVAESHKHSGQLYKLYCVLGRGAEECGCPCYGGCVSDVSLSIKIRLRVSSKALRSVNGQRGQQRIP